MQEESSDEKIKKEREAAAQARKNGTFLYPEQPEDEEELIEEQAQQELLENLKIEGEDILELLEKINQIDNLEKAKKLFKEIALYSHYIGKENKKTLEEINKLKKIVQPYSDFFERVENKSLENLIKNVDKIIAPGLYSRFQKTPFYQSIETAVKKAKTTYKLFKIGVVSAVIVVLASAGITTYSYIKSQKSLPWVLDDRVTTIESILTEGPQTPEQKGISEFLIRQFNKFQPKSTPENPYTTKNDLETALKDYSTTEDTRKEIETAKGKAIELSQNHADEKYNSLDSKVSSYIDKLTLLETRANNLETDLKSKLNSEDFEKFKTEEVENYKKQLNLYETQLNESKTLSANLEKELTEAKISREQYEILKKDLEKTNSRYEELNKKYDTLKRALDKKQDKPKPKKFLGIIPTK